jgi:enoyl-CoA hydratase
VSSGNVRSERNGKVALVTLDDAATKNAINEHMLEQLRSALRDAEADRDVRAVVITGANEAFSSGHHIGELQKHPEDAWNIEKNHPFWMPREMDKPVLAAVDGPAYGAGFILTIACDIRYATPSAKFCGSGARMGLLPIGGQLSWLPHVMSTATAFEMLVTGEPLSAEAALHAGFVSRIIEPARLLETTLERAQIITANAPEVVKAIKRGFRASMETGIKAGQLFEETEAYVHGSSSAAKEGAAAFLEKRRPQY